MDVIHPLPMDTIAHKANRAGTTVRRISRLGAGLLFIMKTYLRQGAAELPAADFRAG